MTSATPDPVANGKLGAGPWWILALEAVGLIALGFLAGAAPFFAAVATTIAVGWILMVAGLVRVVSSVTHRGHGWGWGVLNGLVAIAAGVLMCARPLVGLVSLTLVLGAYFAAHAILSFVRAATAGRRAGRASWLVVSGVMDLVLAAIVVMGLWSGALWLIGVLVAVNLVFAGAALLTLALGWRTLHKPGRPAAS